MPSFSERYNSVSSKWEYKLGIGDWTESAEAYQDKSFGLRIHSLHYDGSAEFMLHSVFKQSTQYSDPAVAALDGNSDGKVSYFEFLASSYHGGS